MATIEVKNFEKDADEVSTPNNARVETVNISGRRGRKVGVRGGWKWCGEMGGGVGGEGCGGRGWGVRGGGWMGWGEGGGWFPLDNGAYPPQSYWLVTHLVFRVCIDLVPR